MRPNFWNNHQPHQQPQQHHSSPQSLATAAAAHSTTSSSSSSVQQHQKHRQRHEGAGQGTPPPAVVLFPDGGPPNGGILASSPSPTSSNSSASFGRNRQREASAFLVRNPSLDIAECPSELYHGIIGSSPHRNQQQQQQQQLGGGGGDSRSPSATSLASACGGGGGGLITTSLGTISPLFCSPNPSPPPGQQSASAQKFLGGPIRVQTTGGSASVARMMSALLKQQNSIAEEEPELMSGGDSVEEAAAIDEPQLLLSGSIQTERKSNGTPPGIGTTKGGGGALPPPNEQQKCWLSPPDHCLLGGIISPPPTRIHPLQDVEFRKDLTAHPQQQQPAVTQIGSQTSELGRHIVALATPIATGPASPSAAASTAQKKQKATAAERKDRKESGGSCASAGGGRNVVGWSRQQSQPWPTAGGGGGRGATSKHRKGSLSPNNSLRYSTLMAAATRRNHFQQQRTTSEATPAQRDQLMADVLGHGIREQCVCASVSAPSPRLMASSIVVGGGGVSSSPSGSGGNYCCCSDPHHPHPHNHHYSHHHHIHTPPTPSNSSAHSCSLRFELGGVDSSASSLNGVVHPPGGGGCSANCSQCSSANSLHRTGSIRHRPQPRGRLNTADGFTESATGGRGNGGGGGGVSSPAGSGSLPRLVSLVPPTFPPASMMLGSSDGLSGGGGQQSHLQHEPKERGDKRSQRESSLASSAINHLSPKIHPQPESFNNNNSTILIHDDDGQEFVGYPQQNNNNGSSNLCVPIASPSIAESAILRRNPARWNLAATKQRSSSESAFSAMPKLAMGDCLCADCQDMKNALAENGNGQQQQQNGGGQQGQRATFCLGDNAISATDHQLHHQQRGVGGTSCYYCTHNGHAKAAPQMRRPDSMSALSARALNRRCSTTIAIVDREQALLQRILGPTGLGWLKRDDPLLKKSLSLVLTDGDLEAQQRQGAISAAAAGGGGAGGGGGGGPTSGNSEKGGGGGCGGPGSILDESNCSVKQPLVKETERGGRFIKRQQLFNMRRVTSDYALFFALFGIVMMIIENEFAYVEHYFICAALKMLIMLSTIILVGLVVKFHVHEIQIFMNANSAEDWQIALTWRKTIQIFVEIVACAICPLPIQMDVYVTTVNSDGQAIPMRMPLDVLFSILMFFRLYWLCRVMLLHSRLFTDAASRSIAGLNRVKTDAKFILKTLMTICPGTVLMLFTATLWMIGGYILRLCERHHDTDDPMLSVQAEKHQSYLNSLWLIAVTFLSIGYGDIVPNTQCGRIMAVVTGILGTCTSSMVVAVIARKLELTRAEKHVHNFMIETQHTKEMKHIAANVLRETWLIYKNRRLVEKIEPSRIRYHQRKFLVAICALRKLKTSQRKLDENRISLGDVAKTTSHSHELMRDVHTTQEGMALRITAVEHQLSDIQRELSGISEMLKYAIRPTAQNEYSAGGCAVGNTNAQQYQQQQLYLSHHQQPNIDIMKLAATPTDEDGQQSSVEMRLQQRRKPSSTISEPIT